MRYLIFFLVTAASWGQWTGKALVGNNQPPSGTFLDSSAPANGDAIAQCGNVVISDSSSSGTIETVGFRWGGTITKAGGSTVMVSLQDADTTAGPPIRPDGVVDQSYTIANADAGFTANSYYIATLGSTRSISAGDLFCVVHDFASYGGADVFSIASWGAATGTSTGSGTSRLNSSNWVDRSSNPNVFFGLSGGKYATFINSFPVSATTTRTWNSGSTPDEYAAQFTVSASVTIDAIFAPVQTAGATSDFELVLYGDASTIRTCSRDASTYASGSALPFICAIEQTVLTPGVTYRISIKPTTTNNVTTRAFTLPLAALRDVSQYSTAWFSTDRTDAGSWSATSDTLLYYFGYRIASAGGASSPGGSFVVAQ
jgi:hypothetical protein